MRKGLTGSAPSFLDEFFRSPEYDGSGPRGCLTGNPVKEICTINLKNHIALDILKNWCERSGLHFGQGIGQGAGEMMEFIENVPLGHGPLKNLGRAINSLADHILARGTGENILFSPNFPRFGWKFTGTHGFWNVNAKKNGLAKQDIFRRPGME